MIKQKTSNTFGDGLILDANPLTATQKSLSNCLNGTFITNDGDEGILLNDMGNYRVDKIKLDLGYVPVGMCTYGGVTYIASYNPLTNKGLVGSFPSPATEGWAKNTADASAGEELTATSTSFIQLLSTDVFRPGDKFDLYLDSAVESALVSHIYNTVFYKEDGSEITAEEAASYTGDITTKIKSPKNKALTVSLCVLDSSGNLHNISSKVNKFAITANSDGTYSYNILPFNQDEDIQLNLGTLFKVKYIDSSSDSSVDANYIDNEPSLIFNSKISSNLFLVYSLNSLSNYTISAEFFRPSLSNSTLDMHSVDVTDFPDAGVAEITSSLTGIVLQVDYLYNSPDGYYDSKDNPTSTNTKYLSDYGFKDDFSPSKVLNGLKVTASLVSDQSKFQSVYLPFDPTRDAISKPVFDYTENLYKSIHKYWYLYSGSTGITTISFTPTTIYGDRTDLLKSLTVDLEKIGSGIMQVTDWKYYVDDDSNVSLNFSIESYPYTGTRLSNVKLEFYNITSTDFDGTALHILTLESRSSYHGSFYTYLKPEDVSLNRGNLYLVIFKYDLYSTSGSLISTDNIMSYRTFLYTLLYNDMYTNLDIANYNDLASDSSDNPESGTYEYYHTYKPQITLDVTETSYGNSTYNSNTLLQNIKSQKKFTHLGTSYTINSTVSISSNVASGQSKYPFSITIDDTNSKINKVYVSAGTDGLTWVEEAMSDATSISSTDLADTPYSSLEPASTDTAEWIKTNIVGASILRGPGNVTPDDDGVYTVSVGSSRKAYFNFTYNYGAEYYMKNVDSGSKNIIITKPYVKYYDLYGEDMYETNTWLTPGYDYDKRSGHRDYHVARYLDFRIYTNNNSVTYYYAEDVPSFIFGDTLTAQSEVFDKHDGLITFTLKDFLEMDLVLNYFDDNKMVLVYYQSGITISKSSDATNTKNDVYVDFVKIEDADGIADWGDTNYTKIPTMLLWKVNGKWYNIKYSGSLTPSSLKSRLTSYFSQFIIPATGSMQYTLSYTPNISSYMYTSDYNALLKYGVDAVVAYETYLGTETYDEVVTRNLATLGISEDDSIRNYVLFNLASKLDEKVITTTTHRVTSAENLHNFVTSLISGTFDMPAYISTSGTTTSLLLYDKDGNSLQENLLYTLSGETLSKSTSSNITNYLKYSDGKIVPNNAYIMTPTSIIKGGGSGDSMTLITTGRLNQIDLNI